jgi:hypothetical protein
MSLPQLSIMQDREGARDYLESLPRKTKPVRIRVGTKEKLDAFMKIHPELKQVEFNSKAIEEAIEKEENKDARQ